MIFRAKCKDYLKKMTAKILFQRKPGKKVSNKWWKGKECPCKNVENDLFHQELWLCTYIFDDIHLRGTQVLKTLHSFIPGCIVKVMLIISDLGHDDVAKGRWEILKFTVSKLIQDQLVSCLTLHNLNYCTFSSNFCLNY